MSEDAIYKNVLEHGTGALNIDRTRIPTEEELSGSRSGFGSGNLYYPSTDEYTGDDENKGNEGRYPANLLLDGVAARMLDEQSGSSRSPETYTRDADGNAGLYDGKFGQEDGDVAKNYGDEGGASRFYYTAKASKSERTINGQIENNHSTVKPLELMEWLVTLVTAPGQRVLDPFTGSGTTIMACKRLNRDGLGIEMDESHAQMARERVELADEVDTDFLTTPDTADDTDATNESDDGPATLESFSDD